MGALPAFWGGDISGDCRRNLIGSGNLSGIVTFQELEPEEFCPLLVVFG